MASAADVQLLFKEVGGKVVGSDDRIYLQSDEGNCRVKLTVANVTNLPIAFMVVPRDPQNIDKIVGTVKPNDISTFFTLKMTEEVQSDVEVLVDAKVSFIQPSQLDSDEFNTDAIVSHLQKQTAKVTTTELRLIVGPHPEAKLTGCPFVLILA